MKNFAKLKEYFQKNPLMAFVVVIVLIPIILGIVAFAGSKKAESDEKQLAIDISPTVGPTREPEEHGADAADEDNEPSPTSKVKKTPTPDESTSPSPSPTPAEEKTAINFLGDVIEDKNCNGSQDNGETKLSDITVNLFKSDGSAYTSVKTDSAGHYSYNSSIDKDSSISLKAEPVVSDKYVLKPGTSSQTFEFKAGSNSNSQNFYFVPKDNQDQCSG